MKPYVIWIIFISVLAAVITVLDKLFAKLGLRRISENSLLAVSAIGGSFAMLATMLIIRHKTRKTKFMAGIPLIILIQLIFAGFIYCFVTGNSII